jgi:hypothetical protein
MRGDFMIDLPTSITFKRQFEGSGRDIIVPEEFIKDFHFSNDNHLMIMLRVIGTDSKKVIDFLNDAEGQIFTLETTGISDENTAEEYILKSMYLDEGPPLSVDINTEKAMVRTILDFKKK